MLAADLLWPAHLLRQPFATAQFFEFPFPGQLLSSHQCLSQQPLG
ncbi:Propionyl-CoA carboxylase beta chain [Altererythrobacter epoxidivorans]|uniref:Propionyl-CoA carboxylase beta chain n=1 Tax=Altererythrobacter epoxidivorans TaxID=361183 RepID=A0A0M4LTG0_9SPHN|nr:Propionyl-CoA carboxylase beta chain [Altererythrobacter epoxidivorans]